MKARVEGVCVVDKVNTKTGEIMHIRQANVVVLDEQKEGLRGNGVAVLSCKFDPSILKDKAVYMFDTTRTNYNGKVKIYADSFTEVRA